MSVRHLALAFVASVCFPAPAFATPIAFTSEAAWLAAVTGVTTETFASSPLGNLPLGTTDIGQFSISVSGTSDGGNVIIGTGAINGTREYVGEVNASVTAVSFGSFDPGPTIVGFAGDWGSTATANVLTATINGVTFNFSTLLGAPGTGFLGFVDPVGFSSISFGVATGISNEVFNLDNARIATGVSSEAVPEPASLLLFGTGLAAAGIRRYRRKQ